MAASIPPQRIEFRPMYEAPGVTAARAAKRHARDIHPEVGGWLGALYIRIGI